LFQATSPIGRSNAKDFTSGLIFPGDPPEGSKARSKRSEGSKARLKEGRVRKGTTLDG
jgi:hypothetical protein